MAKNIDLTSKVSIKETIEYIIHTYHRPLQKMIKKLEPLIHNLDIDYGDEYGEISQISELFCQFRREILKHLWKEEGVIFPAMIEFEKTLKKWKNFNSIESINSVEELVHNTKMLNEHEEFDSYLSAIKALLDSPNLVESKTPWIDKIRKIIRQLQLDTIDHSTLEDKVLYTEAVEVQRKLREKIDSQRKLLLA